jgi:hypothetical protein
MGGHQVDIWSEREVVSYLNDLIEKGGVRKCSKLKLEVGFLNAYYPRCMSGFASREEAHNVKTSSDGDSAPRHYAWPVCPAVCPFFEEAADFVSSLSGETTGKRALEKEALAMPEMDALATPQKESLITPEIADVFMIQQFDEKTTLEPEKAPKEVNETVQRADQTIPGVQIKKGKRLPGKKGLPASDPGRGGARRDYVDIWSEKEVVNYVNDLIQKGSVKKCSKLKLEVGYLNAYSPRCVGGFASREAAHNVKTSLKGDTAPRQYAWPVCPEVCPFFEETTDFPSSLSAKPTAEQIGDKEPRSAPRVAEVSIIQQHEEKKILEPEKILRRDDGITRRVDQPVSEMQIRKLKKLSRKTGLSVSEHIQRALDEYLSRQETGNE